MAYTTCDPRQTVRRKDWKKELFNQINGFREQQFFAKHPLGHPAVNIAENEGNFKVEIIAPGFDKKDFKLNVDKELLTVSATIENEEVDVTKYFRKEFGNRSFKRSFHLPNTVDLNSVQANYDNGILTITLPKTAEAKAPSRTIEVS